MEKKAFAEAVTNLAVNAGLRRIADGKRTGDSWVGIYSGIFVVMHLDAMRLHVEFTSPEQEDDAATPDEDFPTGNEPDELSAVDESNTEDEVDAFERTSAAGLPGEWFVQNEFEPWGFQLVIDEHRRGQLVPDCFDGVFHCIAADLHDLGADTSQPCAECGSEATTLGYFETISRQPVIAPYCKTCWETTREETGGVIRTAVPKKLWHGWAFLALGSVVFAVLWGYAQHPAIEIPMLFLVAGCCGAGIALAMATSHLAQGSNLWLRLGVVVGILAATAAGNILGLKLALDAQGVKIPLLELAPLYFTDYLPLHVGQELLYFAGGVLGVAIAFFMLRESERVRLR